MFLCCDLGGTNGNWGVFDPRNNAMSFRHTLRTADCDDFYQMLEMTLDKYKAFNVTNEKIEYTTLAVAGPTRKKDVRPTNIEGWEINLDSVSAILQEYGHSGRSSILNDFEALGYGNLYLAEHGYEKDDFVRVYGRFRAGPVRVGQEIGTRSLICGPGTGLGIACVVDGLTRDGYPYIISSEGGHHSIPPETGDQYRFLGRDGKFAGKRSYEEVISGPGLRNVYNFYRRADYGEEPNYGIPPREIVAASKMGKDQAATDAVEMFCEALASFCGNMALIFNCDKTIFLWGGALTDISIDLLQGRFKRHFADRCAHSERVVNIPVVLITNADLPLLGCAHHSKFAHRLETTN